jgi:hypothetical protein
MSGPVTLPSQRPRQHAVACLSPAGLHRMGYVERGDPRNPRAPNAGP